MIRGAVRAALVTLFVIAFCTPARASSLERIDSTNLRKHTSHELTMGSPSFALTSRILYREGLELVELGNSDKAREKFLLAAELSGDFPDPLYSLALLELKCLDTVFIQYLIEGIERQIGGYHTQSLLGLNLMLITAASMLATISIILLVLVIKYWPMLVHKFNELYSKRFAFHPDSFAGLLVAVALVIMRLGAALYSSILVLVLWPCMNRKEKGVVVAMMLLISAGSILTAGSGIFLPALDSGSVTRRLALINERGADEDLIRTIGEIDDPAFEAERKYALGTLMYRLDQLDLAKQYLLESVSMKSDFAAAYLNLGNIYFKQGEYDKALAGYQNVIAIDSTNALAHYNIGQTYINKMLFGQSSFALKNANKLGIEDFRKANPATRLEKQAVYSCGFDRTELWRIAAREADMIDGVPVSEVLQPFTLFPFHRIWILLLATMIIAPIISRSTPASWKVFRCDNCGTATCTECSDAETGIRLCSSCSGVIEGLSSLKVMEALLRHKRQKIGDERNRRNRWKIYLVPGASYIYHGYVFSGAIVLVAGACAFLSLAWGGFYFKDPRIFYLHMSLWKIIIPTALLVLGYFVSLRVKAPPEPRNYRILPPELKVADSSETRTVENREEEEEKTPEALLSDLL